ncbi:MAG: type II toxin-antitoxin system VapC family toxin [Alphaproteobacteria bacterium]|nr:type II toxin-antitoxin system VapC family toxin [Alphaproteobacteria bacterium]MCB9699411.1 type II toxin-antitoxin system VapC family toxin [Alphaproteobacteria bacterium]
MRLVLDTSAYSQLRRGHAGVLDALAEASVVLVPTTVLGELHAGFALGGRRLENEQALAEFLDEPFVAVLPVTIDVARRYGELYATLRRVGTPIPINDVWIAAATMDCGATLATFDTDFERVAGLPLRRW